MVGRGQRLAGRDHHRSVHAHRDVHHRRAGDAVIDEHARVVRGEGKGHRLARRDVPEGPAGRHPSRVKIERVRHCPAVVEGDLDGLTLPHVQHRSRNLPVERPGTKAHPGCDLDRAILDRDGETSHGTLDGRRQVCRERHEGRISLHALDMPNTLGGTGGASRRPQQGTRRESTQTAEQHAPAGLRCELHGRRRVERSIQPLKLSSGSGVHRGLLDLWPAFLPKRRLLFVSATVCVPILLKTFGRSDRSLARLSGACSGSIRARRWSPRAHPHGGPRTGGGRCLRPPRPAIRPSR